MAVMYIIIIMALLTVSQAQGKHLNCILSRAYRWFG